MKTFTPKIIKIFKTLNLYCCFFVLGLCVAVPGPCLLDLQHLVQTSTQKIAFIYTARSGGYLLGSMLGGILLDAVKSKQIVLTICNMFVAFSIFAIPWSGNLGTLTGFMIVNGLSLGAVDTGGNVVCLTLWGSDSGPFYQALHFTFGLGGLVAPLIAAPFLGEFTEDIFEVTDRDNATMYNNITHFTTELTNYNSSVTSGEIVSSKIIFPFGIIGVLGLLVTFMFLFICIVSPYEENSEQSKNSEDSKADFKFMFSVISLNFILLFVETGTEIGYAQMLTTHVVKGELGLTTTTGSFMTSTFWAAFTISRLAQIFVAIKVSNFYLILFDLVVSVAGSLVLLFFSSHEWSIWVASTLLGVGIASFFPAAIGWLDTYIDVTNKIASVFTVGAAFGEMFVPFIISYFIETIPSILTYLVPFSCISSSFIVFLLYLILRKRDTKSSKVTECPSVTSPTSNVHI